MKITKIETYNSISIVTNPVFNLLIFGKPIKINKYGKEYYIQENEDLIIETDIVKNNNNIIDISKIYQDKFRLRNLFYLISLYYQYEDEIKEYGKVIFSLSNYVNSLFNRYISNIDIDKYTSLFTIISNIVISNCEKNLDSKNNNGKKYNYNKKIIYELQDNNKSNLLNINFYYEDIKDIKTYFIVLEKTPLLDIFTKYGINKEFPIVFFRKLNRKTDMSFYLAYSLFRYQRVSYNKKKGFNIGLLALLNNFELGKELINTINNSSRKQETINNKIIKPLQDVILSLFEIDKLNTFVISNDLNKTLLTIQTKEDIYSLKNIIRTKNYKSLKFFIDFKKTSKNDKTISKKDK